MTKLPRIIGWAELKQLVPFSRQHIWRLERDMKFPRRVRVGANRVGWLQTEIEAWMTSLAVQRDESTHMSSRLDNRRS